MRAIETLDPPADATPDDESTELRWCPACEIGVHVWRATGDKARVRRTTLILLAIAGLLALAGIAWVVHALREMRGFFIPSM